jgi:putative inorganic carbon (HCO3(-)) transporter
VSPGLVAAALGAALITPFVRPSLLLSLGITGSLFSANADLVGLPVSPDRPLIAAAFVGLVTRLAIRDVPTGPRCLRATDVLAVLFAVLAACSAVSSVGGALPDERFRLLDVVCIPVALLLLSDRFFPTDADRKTLVTVLGITGAYLAVTTLADAAHLDALVFPRYILDDSVGIHPDRARGPMVEAAANGAALVACGAAALFMVSDSPRRPGRLGWAIVAFGCAAGVVTTLTRASWLAAIVATVLAGLSTRSLRRRLPLLLGALTLATVLAFALVPGLSSGAEDRSQSQRPIWDRLNTNAAAVDMATANPLDGVGWGSFRTVSPDYLRLADSYPLTGQTIVVHNVLLGYAAELGLVGAGVWLLAVGAAARAGWRGSRRLPAQWRPFAVAVFASWAVVGTFGPLRNAFPNLCTWAVLGIVSSPTARRSTVPGGGPVSPALASMGVSS